MFSISIHEITFREQELNWLFAKYKRLENNPLYDSPGLTCVLPVNRMTPSPGPGLNAKMH